MQELSNGKERVVVEGNTVRQVIENLEQSYPGFRERLIDQNRVKPNIAVAIDGREHASVATSSEILDFAHDR